MRRLVLMVLILTAFILTSSIPAAAQQARAELRGKITDALGGVLPGVTIVIRNQESGLFREVITGADGSFFAAQLVPGVFTVTAELAGFSRSERPDLEIRVGQTQDIEIVLEVGQVSETLTVSAASPLVDLTSAEVGGTITSGELIELPMSNRSYHSAVALLPGIQYLNAEISIGADDFVANGQARGDNFVGLDGTFNNDDASGSSYGGQVRVPIETIAEIQILTNQFDAEFGQATGAIVNSITKQGTNRFTGAAYNYFIDESLTSKDFFVKQSGLDKPETVKKEYGGVIGGPIIQNKMHFFFSLEKQNVQPSRTRVFPSRPELNFSTKEEWKSTNTLIRVDNQVNANNSWAYRWLREKAPQENLFGTRQATPAAAQTEDDNDQIHVGTYTRVFGSNAVNSFDVSTTAERVVLSSNCVRETGLLTLCPPTFTMKTFSDNERGILYDKDHDTFRIDNTFSWFVPNKKGTHDLKFGGSIHRARWDQASGFGGINGNFRFNTDQVFNPLDPSTFPERLTVTVGNPRGSTFVGKLQLYEAFAQDKWQVTDRLTLGLGVRYDLEVFRTGIADNPLIPNAGDSIDKNNLAPRTSLVYDVSGDGRSVVRAGYGIFYGHTLGGGLDNFLGSQPFVDSFSRSFPFDTIDPGPSNGQFPTDPFLLNFSNDGCPANPNGACPEVDRAAIDLLFPPGSLLQNAGTVWLDSPNRKVPFSHQFSFGYERELMPTLSVSVDYIRQLGRDLLAAVNYQPQLRAGTGRADPITRIDAFGVLGEGTFANNVLAMESVGESTYDGLNVQLEKRYADRWGARLSYALGKSRGQSFSQTGTLATQVGADLNLDDLTQPSSTDRRHILALSGRTELPGGVTVSGVLRAMSGLPLTISNSNFDLNQNGIFFDPVAAGTFSGAAGNENAITVENDGGFNGAYGPDFLQLDVRFGYKLRPHGDQTLWLYFDIFNLTNHVNFRNPSGDMRLSSFLILRQLHGGTGFPRQGQFGVRYAF